MKRTLLIGAALAFAAMGFAQTNVHSEPLVKNSLPKFQLVQNQAVRDNGTMNVRKAKSNGVYYKRPKGAYYQGWGLDGYGYGPSVINIAPWTEVRFENMNNNKAGTWQMYYYGSADEGYPQLPVFEEEDLATLVDNGDFMWSQSPGYLYYTPTLTNRNRTFTLGEENVYIHEVSPNYAGRILTDSIGVRMAADDHQRYVDPKTNKNSSNTFGWGSLNNDNLYGTGKIEEGEDTYISYGAYQVFDTPMSPLYIERAFAHGCSFKRKPIAEGDTLFCEVTNVVKQQTQNGYRLVPGDKVLATMFAVASDTLDFVSESERNKITIYDGTVLFSQRTLDDFGIETVEGVTVDPADLDENGFAFLFYGFDRPGVDFGLFGLSVNSDVDDIEDGHMLVYDAATGDGYDFRYTDLALKVGFEGMYDYVEVLDNDGLNVLRISNDGQSCLTDGAVSEEDGLPGAAVYTAQPWYDEDLNEYYEIVDAPEWLTAVVADESMRNEDGYNGLEIVSFICQPLPANVSGRSAVVYVRGRGFTAAQPIYLLQGDATIETAISEVSTAAPVKNAKVFNLNGQEVNKNVKGILIQNGKKYINK